MSAAEPRLSESLVALLRECRIKPTVPADDAPLGERWAFLWRSLLADALTWRGLAVLLLMEAVAVFLTVMGYAN